MAKSFSEATAITRLHHAQLLRACGAPADQHAFLAVAIDQDAVEVVVARYPGNIEPGDARYEDHRDFCYDAAERACADAVVKKTPGKRDGVNAYVVETNAPDLD